ncbi:MAG: 5-formyltetrahydrofolate cyclo-ligase [Myxococcales bacterium]|nr:MAG: 5-formyltetrahydrofolate cyclo-ligase [Myxococcales bacterium]
MPLFDVTQVTELAEAAKKELRKRMRAVRTALPAEALAARSAQLVARAIALPAFQDARSVALFYPMEDRKEVDLRALDAAARAAGKRVYYPFLEQREQGGVSGLRLTSSLSELAPAGSRFLEPRLDAEQAARADVDLLFVPALAVAPTGHRLGYGAGFYDSLLPDVCPPGKAVAVAFDFQLLVELPTLAHDVPCDFVLTDARALVATRA